MVPSCIIIFSDSYHQILNKRFPQWHFVHIKKNATKIVKTHNILILYHDTGFLA